MGVVCFYIAAPNSPCRLAEGPSACAGQGRHLAQRKRQARKEAGHCSQQQNARRERDA